MKEAPEETSKVETFIDVLNKACETELIYSTEDHCKELEKYNYIQRRALIEFTQLIKETNAASGSATQYGGSRFFSATPTSWTLTTLCIHPAQQKM